MALRQTVTDQTPAVQAISTPVAKTPLPTIENRGLPSRLRITSLGVNANIGYMGVTANGNMETPTNITDVGWYKNGPLPGSVGSAVIAGHIDGPRGEPAVFFSLNKLQPGDNLSVIDDLGRTTSFVVRETHIYNFDQNPTEVFSSSEGAHLNLITCSGNWDKGQRAFAQRLVVFSDKL